MRAVIALAAAITVAMPANATEPNAKQANVIKHIADALVLAERCGKIEINTTLATATMLFHDMPKNSYSPGGPFERAMAESIRRAKSDMGAMEPDHACAAAMLMFGPNGGNVPDLIEAKR